MKETIDHWFSDRLRRLTSSTWRYPQERKRLNDTSVVDVTMLAMSHLQDEELPALAELFKLKEVLIFLPLYDIMFFVLFIFVVLIKYCTFTAYHFLKKSFFQATVSL